MERNLVRVASTTPAFVAIDLMISCQAHHAVSMSFITKPCALIVSCVDCAQQEWRYGWDVGYYKMPAYVY